MTTHDDRALRLRRANVLIRAIAMRGRRFFFDKATGSVSRFELDARGRVWWVDKHGSTRVYLHRPGWGRFRGFSEGGTLRGLVLDLRDYIMYGMPIGRVRIGPWPLWISGGDLWDYGEESMYQIRRIAFRLKIIDYPIAAPAKAVAE